MKYNETFFCWFLAFSLSWTNLTNGWAWITFASVSDFTAKYYNVSLSRVNWISLLYALIMTVGTVPFIWIIDRYGVKFSLVISSVLNLLCAIFHCISSLAFVNPDYRYHVLVLGSVLGGFAQPLCLFSSTKLAATWFSPENRVSANTIAAMGNPLGVLSSSLISPIIVTDKSKLPTLNIINLIPPIIGLVMVLISIYFAPVRLRTCSLTPNISLSSQIKMCLHNLPFWIIVVSFGILLAIFTTISTLIQQILCPLGYSDMFSGICGALFLAMGIAGVLIVGPIVARVKAMTEVVKWGVVLTTFGLIGFSVVSTLSDLHILVALSVAAMGLFGFGVYPSTLELAAETAHPAGEVLSTGFIIATSQMLSLVFVTVSEAVAIPIKDSQIKSVCSISNVKNYWIATTCLSVIGVLNATVFLFTFKTKYKRVISEIECSNSGEICEPLVDQEK